jgi:hypothetical protein
LVDADLGGSLEERKAKLKDAVDEYENLDHEDMASLVVVSPITRDLTAL